MDQQRGNVKKEEGGSLRIRYYRFDGEILVVENVKTIEPNPDSRMLYFTTVEDGPDDFKKAISMDRTICIEAE